MKSSFNPRAFQFTVFHRREMSSFGREQWTLRTLQQYPPALGLFTDYETDVGEWKNATLSGVPRYSLGVELMHKQQLI
jgi:hypothetical protein